MKNVKITRTPAPVIQDIIQIELSVEQARVLRHVTCFINNKTVTDDCSDSAKTFGIGYIFRYGTRPKRNTFMTLSLF